MKIVIQDGTIISRIDLESFVKIVPASWLQNVRTIVIYVSSGDRLITSFHGKEKSFGIHIPRSFRGSKEEVLTEIACTFQAIGQYGHIPGKIPVSRVKEYMKTWNELLYRYQGTLPDNAVNDAVNR